MELIRSLVPLGLMHVEELLDEEVTALAGARYARKDGSTEGRRQGYNPGTVGLAGQRVPLQVPRLRGIAGSEIPLRSYAALHGNRAANDLLLKRVLYGISCRNYEAAAEAIPGAIGLSGSTVSRGFIQASAAKLRELQERDLSREDVAALARLLDPCYRADENRRLANHLDREFPFLFAYLKCPGLEATNYRAEQAIRPAAVIRKVWGGNRTAAGARTQEILMSVLRTSQQNDVDPLPLIADLLRSPHAYVLEVGPLRPAPPGPLSHPATPGPWPHRVWF